MEFLRQSLLPVRAACFVSIPKLGYIGLRGEAFEVSRHLVRLSIHKDIVDSSFASAGDTVFALVDIPLSTSAQDVARFIHCRGEATLSAPDAGQAVQLSIQVGGMSIRTRPAGGRRRPASFVAAAGGEVAS